jgi:hypothetical protein
MEVLGLVLIFILVLLVTSRAEGHLRRSKRALEISEENLALARQLAAMQAENNRLLGRLIEKFDPDSANESSYD